MRTELWRRRGGTCNGTGKTPNKPPEGYAVTLKPGTYDGLEIKGNVKMVASSETSGQSGDAQRK